MGVVWTGEGHGAETQSAQHQTGACETDARDFGHEVFLILDALLPKQVAIPKKEIVEKLEMVYKGLKIQKKAKATDIKA